MDEYEAFGTFWAAGSGLYSMPMLPTKKVSKSLTT